jgi:hypothetical protein
MRLRPILLGCALSTAGCDAVLGISAREAKPNLICTGEDQCHCAAGYGDCDGDTEPDCDTHLASDPAHCGRCGHGCEGGACVGGVCQPVEIASDLEPPLQAGISLLLLEGHVYVATESAVFRAPVLGDGWETVVAATASTGLAADASGALYYTTGAGQNRQICRLAPPAAGGRPLCHRYARCSDPASCGLRPADIAVEGRRVYFASPVQMGGMPRPGLCVGPFPSDGGDPLTASCTWAGFTVAGSAPYRIAVVDDAVMWLVQMAVVEARIQRSPAAFDDGAVPLEIEDSAFKRMLVARRDRSPGEILFGRPDASTGSTYVSLASCTSAGRCLRAPLEGAEPIRLLQDIALADGRIYYSTLAGDVGVVCLPESGADCHPGPFFHRDTAFASLAVAERVVFFIQVNAAGKGSLLRLAKP